MAYKVGALEGLPFGASVIVMDQDQSKSDISPGSVVIFGPFGFIRLFLWLSYFMGCLFGFTG